MSINSVRLCILVFCIFGFSFVAQARDDGDQHPPPEQSEPTEDEWKSMLDEALPKEVITEDYQKLQDLVRRLLSAKLGTPLSESFSQSTAIKTIWPRGGYKMSSDCRTTTTSEGDIDPGECSVIQGTPSSAALFKELRYSKNMVLGNVSYLYRKALKEISPDSLSEIKMTDEEAYEKALSFLNKVFGLTMAEIPVAPKDAKVPLPVKTIAMGWGDPKGETGNVPVEKIVMLQRGLSVEFPEVYNWLPGPGRAMVILDDNGVKEAVIRNWVELKPHPNADPQNAKTRFELLEEMTEDLFHYNKGPVSSVNIRIALSTVPSEPSESGIGLMLPAIQVLVSPVPGELSEEEQAKVWTTAGFIREYSMVRLEEVSDEVNAD